MTAKLPLNIIRVQEGQARHALEITCIPRDDDGLNSLGAGGDQGIGNFMRTSFRI